MIGLETMKEKFGKELFQLIINHPLHSIPKDSYVLIEGEFCPGIPLVVEGEVKVIKEEESGKEMTLYRINPGEGCIMSITSTMLTQPTEASAVSESDVKMYLIPMETSQEWIRTYPLWMDFILRTTNHRYFDLIKLVHDVSFKSTGERLIDFLKGMASDDTLEVSVKHEALAKELGTAREVVSRLLKAFEKQGVLVMSRGNIKLIQ